MYITILVLLLIASHRRPLMKTAAVSELKARLSEYLNEVKGGGEVLVTDRGKPVARLIPVAPSSNIKDSLLKLEKQGLIKRGTGALPRDFWTAERPEDQDGLVLKALLEERETGR
jgi:prevent-host-death family protein